MVQSPYRKVESIYKYWQTVTAQFCTMYTWNTDSKKFRGFCVPSSTSMYGVEIWPGIASSILCGWTKQTQLDTQAYIEVSHGFAPCPPTGEHYLLISLWLVTVPRNSSSNIALATSTADIWRRGFKLPVTDWQWKGLQSVFLTPSRLFSSFPCCHNLVMKGPWVSPLLLNLSQRKTNVGCVDCILQW